MLFYYGAYGTSWSSVAAVLETIANEDGGDGGDGCGDITIYWGRCVDDFVVMLVEISA